MGILITNPTYGYTIFPTYSAPNTILFNGTSVAASSQAVVGEVYGVYTIDQGFEAHQWRVTSNTSTAADQETQSILRNLTNNFIVYDTGRQNVPAPNGTNSYFADSNGGLTPGDQYRVEINHYTAAGNLMQQATATWRMPPGNFVDDIGSGKVGISYFGSLFAQGATNITRSGSLPPGLTGSFTGGYYDIQGTPTTAGTYSFTLNATNSGGTTQYFVSLLIENVPPPGSFTNLPFPNAQRRVPYSYSTSVSNATSITVVSGALPPGLTGARSGTTWTLSGTPTTEGNYTFGLRASNEGPNTSSTQVQLQVFPPPTFSTPNVVSRTQAAGTSILTTAPTGYFGTVTPTFVTAGATAVNNLTILSQTISSGTTAFYGDTIGISVYDFRAIMPQLVTTNPRTTGAEAIQRLSTAGFATRTASTTTAGATLANNLTVASQVQTALASFNIATNIQYTLFDYRVAVPNVVTSPTLTTRDAAITTLINAGFTNIIINLALPGAGGATALNNGRVKSQSPVNSATTYNPATQAVTLTVYSLGVVGRRMTGSGTSSSLTTAKRFNGTAWVDITVAKRFNGTAWVDITNG